MATNKKTETAPEAEEQIAQAPIGDNPEELVEYMAPVILGKTDQTVFSQVNGENIRIQRGKTVKIKRKFKEVLDHAAQQEMAAFAYMEDAQKSSSKALADLN